MLSAGAFIFLREGGGKDSPSGKPLLGAPLKMVRYFLGSPTSPCPPGPTLGCGPVGTQALKTSSWIRLHHLLALLAPLSPHQSLFPMSEAPSDQKNPIGNSLLALVEFIRPSVRLSIHPCHQFDHLAPLAGQVSHHQPGEPVRAAYALPLPHHIHPYEGA